MPSRTALDIIDALRLVAAGDGDSRIESSLHDHHPADLVDAFDDLSEDERSRLLQNLSPRLLAYLFPYLSEPQFEAVRALRSDADLATVLEELSSDDAVDLLEQLSRRRRRTLVDALDPARRATLRPLLRSVPESAGTLMTTELLALAGDVDVDDALQVVRRRAKEVETPYAIYVVTDEDHLRGVVSLRELLAADPGTTLEELMHPDPATVHVDDDQEVAADVLGRYDLVALPVLDDQGHLVGVITHDDIFDVATEEATEDFQKGAALAPLERSYTESRVFRLFQKRIGWLMLLIVVNLVSSGIIEAYEATLEQIIALAFFIPLLIDSGGNTGTQSATVMVRALATGEIELRQWWRALAKEVFVGLSLGAVMGLGSALLGFYRGDIGLALVVGLSMGAIVIAANLIGTLLPFLLTKLNIDPAVASSPLITSVADAAGLFIYFGIATAFLSAGLI